MNERLAKERAETDTLEREALELGIEIPKNLDWWWDDGEDYSGPAEMMDYAVSYYLTPQGKAGFKRLIREELARIKDRKIRWACQIIAAVTGLAGAVIGILAIILSMLRK